MANLKTKHSGTRITPEIAEALAGEAERGYDLSREAEQMTKDLREDYETRAGEQPLLPKAPAGLEPIPTPKPPREYETPPRIPPNEPQELPPDYQAPPPVTRRSPWHRWGSHWPV